MVTALTLSAQESAQLQLQYSGGERQALLLKVFAVYAGKALLPVRLSALYVVGKAWMHPVVALLGALALAGCVVAFFAWRHRRPVWAFSLALYLLPLATVLNTFFTLRIWLADRYLFFPTIG